MKVLVNALSVTNQSGRHVLMGHLDQIRQWTEGKHEFAILFHDTNRDIVTEQPGYEWIECPAKTSRWRDRALWECRNVDQFASEHHCDFVFTPAGVTVPGLKTPQVVFCQNPWCLVPELHTRVADRMKACLQRRAYARAMREAALVVFNSEYMHRAYRHNAGTEARSSLVVYQAISETTWEAAERLGKSLREANHIVCVSAMGNHKGAEVLVRALQGVHRRGIAARLTFAGGWPEQSYRRQIESLVDELGLADHVTFCGWITDEQLHELYSRADVFCLLSRCESFGIPAVEAQSFGTPTLGTDTCAIPEVGGDGGLYSPVNDADAAAENLYRVLSDDALWQSLSEKAAENAKRYRWNRCSRPLMRMFDVVESMR